MLSHRKNGFTPAPLFLNVKYWNSNAGASNITMPKIKLVKSGAGFTLIELLVVIAIITLLASVVLVALNSARKKARIAKRLADLSQIAKALELYFNDNGNYPTSTSAEYRSECPGTGWSWTQVTANNVIPGLVPQYMTKFPSDPSMDFSRNGGDGGSCYAYVSDPTGKGYKVLDHIINEFSFSDYLSHPELVDTSRDGGSTCALDGSTPWSWAISSPNFTCIYGW